MTRHDQAGVRGAVHADVGRVLQAATHRFLLGLQSPRVAGMFLFFEFLFGVRSSVVRNPGFLLGEARLPTSAGANGTPCHTAQQRFAAARAQRAARVNVLCVMCRKPSTAILPPPKPQPVWYFARLSAWVLGTV